MDEEKTSPLQVQLHLLLDRRKQQSRLRSLKASPEGSIDFSSNDFLSLSSSPIVKAIFLDELQNIPRLSSTGSRLLDGNSSYAENLERDIAKFHNSPAGLLTNSGFDANVGIFSCLPQPGDIVIYDELIHASVHDGIKASRAGASIPFAHNSVLHLKSVLEAIVSKSSASVPFNLFIAVESVYSMDGDLAPLIEIVQLIEALFPDKNAHLIVDEAHATGLYGEKGRGRVCDLGLENKVFVRLHTFGKALACNGAIILCTPLTRQYLINYARPLIYTTFMSFPALAAIKAVYTFMAQGRTEQLAKELTSLITLLYSNLRALRDKYSASNSTQNLLRTPSECPKSPIISLLTSDPRGLAQYCQRAGFVVRAIVAPTVPEGFERVRVCLHAANTSAQAEKFVQILQTWIEQESHKSQKLSEVVGARL
ncbi:hypothetical protein GJ744_008064 [Endocarpon pusillum]|uniref:Aminotransferase class I/classII large domain-containing protein n=1 Tax=Endocarpon pusillum TaxID=364733 RepID=A0A8H7ALM2_9EURO|nr:hypothetical protein GJ744_008064 [Endocarpon pusillum]